MSDPSARTEPPSPRALQRARERGDVPESGVASLAFSWAGLCLGVGVGGAAAVDALVALSTRTFSLATLAGDAPLTGALEQAASVGASALLWPLAGALVLGALGAAMVMGKVVLTPVRVDLGRLSPARNLDTARDLRPRLGALAAAALLGLVLVDLFRDAAPGVFGRLHGSAEAWRHAASVIGEALMLRVAIALLILGAAAAAYARHRWRQRQRMTRREQARERRETEGDPVAQRRRRRRHRELSDAPSRHEILRNAALLVRGDGITVALAWANREAAPTIDAVAVGPTAARLALEGARVPTVLDPALALTLARCPRGREVPPRLWPRLTRPLARAEQRSRAGELDGG